MRKSMQILLGTGAAFLAYASVVDSQASRWRVKQPERALEWRADDAAALTMNADLQAAQKELSAADSVGMANVARRALRDEPLTSAAIRQLAVAEGLMRQEAATSSLLALARQVNRRDFGTSWLLIDQGLSTGDLPLIVRSFDEALLTSTVAPDLTYPALSASLFDPALRTALVPYLRGGSIWMPPFLRYAADVDAGNVALLVIQAGGIPRRSLFTDISGPLLAKLAQNADFGNARKLLLHVADPNYAGANIFGIYPGSLNPELGPFGWKLIDRPEISAQFDGRQGLDIRADPEISGGIASRILLLEPGTYRVVRKMTVVDPNSAKLQWTFDCVASREKGEAVPGITKTEYDEATETQEITVPANCPAQRIGLVVEALSSSEEIHVKIEKVTIKKIG